MDLEDVLESATTSAVAIHDKDGLLRLTEIDKRSKDPKKMPAIKLELELVYDVDLKYEYWLVYYGVLVDCPTLLLIEGNGHGTILNSWISFEFNDVEMGFTPCHINALGNSIRPHENHDLPPLEMPWRSERKILLIDPTHRTIEELCSHDIVV